MKRVISQDGGGFRGQGPLWVVDWLETTLSSPASSFCDLFVGTSAGGINSAGLVYTKDGKTPAYRAKDLLAFYRDEGATICPHEWDDDLRNKLQVKYPATGIESVLKRYYGDAPLSSALSPVVITAYDQGLEETVFFKSRKAKLDPKLDVPLWYASRATSAAPTFWPNIDNLVDGGIGGVTNPSMVALIEAHKMWPGEPICLLSIGTGKTRNSIDKIRSTDWGQVQYVTGGLVQMFLSGPESTVERMVQDDLNSEDVYVRIQKDIVGSIPDHQLDNVTAKQYADLSAFFHTMIEENKPALESVAKLFSS
jgi:patatin-like phospholipase/acyl hydrolase